MTRTLTVRPYQASDHDEWNALVRRSASAHFLFLREYMEYHSDRFSDLSLLVYEGRRLLAAMPANVGADEIVSHGGLTFGGVLADARLRTSGMSSVFEALLTFLEGNGIRRCIYKCVPHIYHRFPAEEDLYSLYRNGARLSRRDLSTAIDLSTRVPYTALRRRSLRGGESAGLTIEQSFEFEEFMEMQRGALERYDAAPVHTGAELALLAKRFPDNIRLVTARLGGRLVAGVVVYQTERVVRTQYMAATPEGRTLNALSVILDRLIGSASETAAYFDFGTSMLEDGPELNLGVLRYKESFGARAVAFDQYELAL
jgi:hypothetical protein